MELVTNNRTAIQQISASAMIAAIKEQKSVIQTVMRDLMVEGEHYGIIPGTNKKTLHKAGAELLTSVFMLAPKYDIEVIELGGGHREYRVTCSLYSQSEQRFLGQGVGSCSTMEKKYRVRKVLTRIGDVPDDYQERKSEYRANGQFAKQDEDGFWGLFTSRTEENPDLADVYNTCLKMAKKRSLNDCTLTVTGASDIFSQDMEDSDGGDFERKNSGNKKETYKKKTGNQQNQQSSSSGDGNQAWKNKKSRAEILEENNKNALLGVQTAILEATENRDMERLKTKTLSSVHSYLKSGTIDQQTFDQCEALITEAIQNIAGLIKEDLRKKENQKPAEPKTEPKEEAA